MNKRRKRAKKRRWTEHPTFLALMKYVEPKEFYEDNYFSPDSEDADSWRFFWGFEKLLIAQIVVMASFQVWWILPVLFFP